MKADRILSGRRIQRLTRKVDLLSLRILLTVATEGGHFARAAAREKIAPSAVSKRMQVMEETIGIRLFERKSQHTDFTAAGRVVVASIREIFGVLSRMDEELDDFAEGVRGCVRVASTEAANVEHLAEELRIFSSQFPHVDVILKVDTNPNTLKAVLTGDADLAIYILTEDVAAIAVESTLYRTDALVALFPSEHPLAATKSLHFRDMLGEDFIALPLTTSLMVKLQGEAEESGKALRIKHEVPNLEVARILVRAGLGVTIQPDIVNLGDQRGFSAVPLSDAWARREIRIGFRPGREPPPPVQALRAQLMSHRSDIYASIADDLQGFDNDRAPADPADNPGATR